MCICQNLQDYTLFRVNFTVCKLYFDKKKMKARGKKKEDSILGYNLSEGPGRVHLWRGRKLEIDGIIQNGR